jgi:hypothetical protein
MRKEGRINQKKWQPVRAWKAEKVEKRPDRRMEGRQVDESKAEERRQAMQDNQAARGRKANERRAGSSKTEQSNYHKRLKEE